jgi:hypothetical protein
MPALCSVSDALGITGQTVTEDQLTKARYDIELLCGRLFIRLDAGVLSDDDADWLTRAIAHQAVFGATHVAKDVAIEATSVSEGGGTISPTPDGVVLSAMARRALNQLSWVGARTVRISRTLDYVDTLNTVMNDLEDAPWEDLT